MDQSTSCPRCWGVQQIPTCLLCDGLGEIRDPLVSPHFRYSELVHSAHRQFPNDPGPDAIGNLRRLCAELLEPVRAVVGPLWVSSAYRSQLLDAHVAGDRQWLSRLSGHSIGAAADVVPGAWGVQLQTVAEAAMALAAWDQVILEGGCVHLALLAPYGVQRQRRQALVRLASPHWLAWRKAGDPVGQEPDRFTYDTYRGTAAQIAAVV